MRTEKTMATRKQTSAAKRNVKKAQRVWQGMSPRARALAQPQGRERKKPGTTGTGRFYRIEVRPKYQFTSFRTQDVGRRNGLERIAGRRSSGSWATATWLVAKKNAHVSAKGELIIDDPKEKLSLSKALRGKIMQVEGDVFHARPRRNVPERAKPTPAMRAAQKQNIRKAQAARRV